MKKKDEQQDYFEADPHEQEIQEIIVPKSSLLVGEANPIYSRKISPSVSEYDQPITLKMVPILQKQQITNYIPFSLSRMKKDRKIKQGEQQDQKNQIEKLNKMHSLLTAKQNMFSKAYESAQIIYCKFDNLRYNLFKDVSYFAGIFLPLHTLVNKFKSLQEKGVNPYTIKTVLKKQSKNKQILTMTNKQKVFYSAPTNINQDVPAPGNTRTYRPRDKLLFDSNFESGNLFTVFRTGKLSYDLILNNDINSKGSTQWFYFSVEGFDANVDYQFSIVNFTKRDSLFNYGMKPVLYSLWQNNGIEPNLQKQQKMYEQKCGWYRYGKDVQYYKNQIQRQNSNRYYYTLNFTINWRHAGDKLYVAHSYPYTHSRMQNIFKSIIFKYQKSQSELQTGKLKEQKRVSLERIKIGQTLGRKQLNAYLIGYKKGKRQKNKQAIIIMARQHPGQTQGSFVCEGIINKLTQNETSKQVKFLLENYYIYVIPMVNPDGVIFGNYRCNLSGKDLNRKWDSSDNNAETPQITSIKQFLINLTAVNNIKIRFVLDLHGHSKKLNSFFYGNPCAENPQFTKIFPYICSRFSEKVQFMDCTFTTQLYKKRAARIYISTLYKQLHVFTFQCSFYGFNNRQGKIIQFTPLEYIKLGEVLMNSLYLFLLKDKCVEQPVQSAQKNSEALEIAHKNSIQMLHKIQTQLLQNQLLMKVGDGDSSGSESKPQQGQINTEQIFYLSEQQQCDQRVIVTHKIINKSQIEKQKQKQKQKQKGQRDISKTKSIRINSRKPMQQNTIEYKDKSKQYRNKKLITLSQVNAVLPDKYHISLLPIQRIAYRSGKSMDYQIQTEKQQKLTIRQFKLFQIQEKNNLVGSMQYCPDEYNEESSSSFFVERSYVSKNSHTQQKKHSEIVAQIERNSRHQIHRQSSQIQKQLINKRKLSQPFNLKSMPKKQKKSKRFDVYTQTIVSIRNLPAKTLQTPTKAIKINDNEIRIAKMEKINQQVLKIYSKKSNIIDLNFKYQTQNTTKNQYKQNY